MEETGIPHLLEQAPVGIFYTDEQGDWSYVNSQWVVLTGLTPDKANNESWQRALHPDDRTDCQHAWKEAVQEHLAKLRLTLNWRRSVVYPTGTGIPFLGYRIYHDYRRLRADNVRLARRRLRYQQRLYHAGQLSEHEFHDSLQSWIAHASHADTYQLRRHILTDIRLVGAQREEIRI